MMTIKVYKKRGLINLIKRVFQYVKEFGIALFIGDGDVLYVSGCPGGSRFYRCQNQAEELEKYGIRLKVISQNNLSLLRLVTKFEVFIFQRLIYDDYIGEVIDAIKKHNKTIIFETDDLVFDPTYIPWMHYYNFFSDEEKNWYQNGIGREILEDSYIKNCIVSTDFLKEKLREKYPSKRIFVSYNKLSKNQINWAKNVLRKKMKIKPNDKKIRIGYFSGSRSHDNDFETVSNVILKILKENKNVILMIVGHLKLNDKFKDVKNQVEKFDFVSLKKFPKLVARVDINIAPLEIDNPFCQAKSALKYFEAGLLEIPTVATATQSFKKVIKNKKTGFLAKNNEDWYNYLSLLINDESLRKKIGQQAGKDSLQNRTTQETHADSIELVKLIKQS